MTKYGIKRACIAIAVLFAVNIAVITLAQRADAASYKRGSTGSVVSEIQQKLKDWGYYSAEVDGIYGSRTEAAVLLFQQKNGLAADGKAGAETLAALGISSEGLIEQNTSGDVALLAGIPSVVYGLVGMTVLVPFVQKTFSLSSGACLLTAILVLTVMILPYIVSVSEMALRAVPREYEEASLALGATKAETWFLVSLRAAKSGVIASIIQGTGRAVGEAMAILMVAGNVANMPSLFASVRFLTTAIVSEMSYAAYGSLQRDALFSVGLVLFLFILLINAALRLLGERSAKA